MAIPPPRNGAVIQYSYLWKHDQEAGLEEGTKNRPAAVILAHHDSKTGYTFVYVLPVTHSPPEDPAFAVEIPAGLKQRLGLDAERSWIVCDEVNRFIWPGFDLRRAPGSSTERWEYGMLSRELYNRAKSLFLKARKKQRLQISERD